MKKTIDRAAVISLEDHKCNMCHMKFSKEQGLKIQKGKMRSENKQKHM